MMWFIIKFTTFFFFEYPLAHQLPQLPAWSSLSVHPQNPPNSASVGSSYST